MQNNVTNSEVSDTPVHESTYALLVRSEEKERNVFENAIYALFILCALFSVWQFVQQPVTLPTHIGAVTTAVATVDQSAS